MVVLEFKMCLSHCSYCINCGRAGEPFELFGIPQNHQVKMGKVLST